MDLRKKFYSLENKLNILKLNDCDDSFKNFKNIEDCFSQKDKIKLDLKNKSFRSHTAYTSVLKKTCSYTLV
ncbi:hypothetical protein KVD13_04560 [Helicobacter pylori]|nr:hypothetical protein KVD13_04560 [Helicobacter pylori]